ncbi:ACP S-malonyltransferase [Tepidimicrobium xylanilyticum]|uniref:Malonyl CoA-acyl carrier protein transacylase n=1 Tax=Tepidimicrobium xylanilyticum TaxID=1123352 RepID=A0A1H2VBX3_9FIRM|nr:ACP S-malonyltransferase [Tepidimicrobium xylanilyticum]GMG96676.1 malonyl CoA-acyl carrier protein transacylase [Tepidimicrobium xylanilyticum]SDW65835.1 [Acyl-carrier-protein] S-malonyltransferase [Tepidimicrobium xylanilyticum]
MRKIAFIFPGQGSQYVGMGADFYQVFPESRRVFEEANDCLNMDLKRICFEGREEELIRTENTQPAILTTSIAMLKALEMQGIDCEYTAGLSLGEYTALVKSEGISFEDALWLVKIRGKLMQEAVPEGVGGMAAILGLSREKVMLVLDRVKEHGIVEVANYNSPEQIVISGEKKGVELACKEALNLGAKKTVPLLVSAPFHTSLLKPAAERLKEELDRIPLFDLKKNLVSNVDGKPVNSKEEIKEKLAEQVSSSVLWQDSIEFMIENGVNTFIEIGPGKALTGFVKRIGKFMNKSVETYNVNSVETLKKTVDSLGKEMAN